MLAYVFASRLNGFYDFLILDSFYKKKSIVCLKWGKKKAFLTLQDVYVYMHIY